VTPFSQTQARLLVRVIDQHLEIQWQDMTLEARAQICKLLSQVYMLTLTNDEQAALHAALGAAAERDN
jgi:hypothetical protein